jgi:HlyD family secretion protein
MYHYRDVFLFFIAVMMATLSACSREPSRPVQGYIEGRYTYMASPVSGVLKILLVKKGAMVHKGQRLFVLEEQPESDLFQSARDTLTQSIAARDALVANLSYAL